MSLLSICESIQASGLSTALRESTWGYPIAGALHVLMIAWFGGLALTADPGLRFWRRLGLAALVATGALLFWIEPVKCYQSQAFRIKMVLLVVAIAAARFRHRLALVCWLSTIFAARWIAY